MADSPSWSDPPVHRHKLQAVPKAALLIPAQQPSPAALLQFHWESATQRQEALARELLEKVTQLLEGDLPPTVKACNISHVCSWYMLDTNCLHEASLSELRQVPTTPAPTGSASSSAGTAALAAATREA